MHPTQITFNLHKADNTKRYSNFQPFSINNANENNCGKICNKIYTKKDKELYKIVRKAKVGDLIKIEE